MARTQAEAAQALGITARQLQNWMKEPWFPPGGQTGSGYDVGRIQAARDAEGLKGSEETRVRSKLRDAQAAEKLRQTRIRTQREELALHAQRGELIPRAALELFASSFLTEFGDWCDQLPGQIVRLVPASAAKTVRQKLTQLLNQRRVTMRDTLAAKAREFDEHGGDQSA